MSLVKLKKKKMYYAKYKCKKQNEFKFDALIKLYYAN